MNNLIINQTIRFFILIILQVFLFNHINLGGSVNPFLYVYFLLLFPVEVSGWIFLLVAFSMGISIDVFSNTYGLHTISSVLVAFLRNYFFRRLSGERDFDSTNIKVNDLAFSRFLIFSSILVFLHHFSYFSLEAFKLSALGSALKDTFFSWIFTMLLILLSFLLIDRKKD